MRTCLFPRGTNYFDIQILIGLTFKCLCVWSLLIKNSKHIEVWPHSMLEPFQYLLCYQKLRTFHYFNLFAIYFGIYWLLWQKITTRFTSVSFSYHFWVLAAPNCQIISLYSRSKYVFQILGDRIILTKRGYDELFS